MDLMDRVDALIDERHLLRHPFYQQWLAGTLPTEALQEYAKQYYVFESAFPRLLSSLHSRTDDPAARQALLDNLWDEEHGDANHRELWLRFAEGMGVDRDDVAGSTPNEATANMLRTYWEACREAPVAAGVAALYAYEAQVPAVATSKIDGLRHRYGVSDQRTLAFFEVHATLDEEHSAAERTIIETHGEGNEDAVLEHTAAALDAWWSFLDAVTPPTA